MTSIDLEPWLIVLGKAPHTSVAAWCIAQTDDLAIAIFSTREKAMLYAEQNCVPPNSVMQFEQTSLIRVFAAGYRQGMRHAALDPNTGSARQIFVLRDVLTAARSMLKQSKETP